MDQSIVHMDRTDAIGVSLLDRSSRAALDGAGYAEQLRRMSGHAGPSVPGLATAE